MVEKMLDILPGAGKKIIDAENICALRQEPLAQVRAEKSRAAGNQNSLLQMHREPNRF
jgi:hypothetical protein